MSCLRTEKLKKTYDQSNIPVEALRGVDLRVEEGEMLALVGPSGSGKTTLLNLIGGLDKPTAGRVFIEGRDITGLSAGELAELRLNRIGFVFQEYNLIPVLTAIENIEYVMLLRGVKEKERKDRALSILKEVGLEGMEHRRPRELSGGQRQRVAVARAVVSEPAIILADEPTANLDSKTGASLLELMRKLNDSKGITIILSTHNKMVVEMTHKTVQLKDGRIIEGNTA
jgi:putative ABC transport system ATP-binding protein